MTSDRDDSDPLLRAQHDPSGLVRDGYDSIADTYFAARSMENDTPDVRLLIEMLGSFDAGARVLDVGCGGGVPVGRVVVEHGHQLVGVDISQAQIELARIHVPSGEFVLGDITELDLPAAGFDLILAYFSVFHVPREHHLRLFQSFRRWLRDGGIAILTVGRDDQHRDVSASWLDGAPMLWSHFDTDTTLNLIEQAGFRVLELRHVPETLDGTDFVHPFVICQTNGL